MKFQTKIEPTDRRPHTPQIDGAWHAPSARHTSLIVSSTAFPKFSVDNPRRVRLIPCMSQPEQKHTTPVSLAVDAVLVAIFFVILFNEVKIHVPSNDSTMITLWSGLTAGCMSGVFWLAVQMFRVVLKAQRAANKK